MGIKHPVCHIEENGDSYGIRVEGELDFGTAYELENALGKCIDNGAKQLRLDLSQVTFIDSEAIKVVLTASYELEQSGGALAVVECSPVVHRAFSLLGLNTVLETDEPNSS